jgi:hypothetical protein
VSEGIERGFTTISALPRVAHTAEGEGWDSPMEEGVVYRSAAGEYFIEDC